MSEDLGCGLFLAMIVLVVFSFAVGFVTGTADLSSGYRRQICQKLSITTEDYINCNAQKFSEVINKIPKVSQWENP